MCGKSSISLLHLRMCHVDPSFEHLRFSKHHVWHTHLIVLHDITQPLEPHQIDKARSIGEMGNHTSPSSLAHLFERENLPHKLDVRHVAVDFRNSVEFRAVNIFIRIIAQ